jgi:hypothetical protein
MTTPSAWAMDIADEIVVSEGLAPISERDLLEKIAAALDAERAAVVAWLREVADAPETYVDEAIALRGASASIERGEHRREEEK